MKNKIILLLSAAIFLISILQFSIAESNYCCEKTTNGAWCQNAPASECDTSFKVAPTSCESTSYCKPGCCFDSQEGLCMESTPQRICNSQNGTWANNSQCKIPQCNLGCCLLGDQGAFVTLTRCKQLSGMYGLLTDFRRTIQDEVVCIATAQGEDKGACVTYNSATGSKDCVFTLRSACSVGGISGTISNSTNSSGAEGFYKDVLCTAEELGTTCSPTTKTTLVEGKDEVYYLDTCNNVANIYDANKYNDKQYWRKVYKKSESCGAGTSNAGSKTCGNCDYYLGSIGKKSTGFIGIGEPTYGSYICANLNCDSIDRKHGESWCKTDSPTGNGLDTAGSRYYKEICLYGEVITEPCADFRNEICVDDTFNGFSEAACRVNRWQDCLQQEEEDDCTNNDLRDCMWVKDFYFSSTTGQIEKSANQTKIAQEYCPEVLKECTNEPGSERCGTELALCGVPASLITPLGICVPNYPPGNVFWGSSNTATSSTNSSLGTGYVNPTSSSGSTGQCNLGDAQITIKWKKEDKIWPSHTTKWTCIQNCQYATSKEVSKDGDPVNYVNAEAWAGQMNEICYKLGDCGGYINWQGKYTEEGFAGYLDNQRVAGSGGSETLESKKTETTTGTTASSATASSSSSNTGTAASALSSLSGTGNVVRDLIKKMVGGE